MLIDLGVGAGRGGQMVTERKSAINWRKCASGLLIVLCALLGVCPPTQAQFVKDTFTGTGGTAIVGGHTGEIGATWTLESGQTDNYQLTTSPANRARATTVNGGTILASGTPGSANYDVQCEFYCNGTPGTNWGVKARETASNNFYYAVMQNANTWNLYKVVSGTQTNLATASFSPTVGHTYTIRLRAHGTTIQMYYSDNGGTFTQVGSNATDSSLTAAGVTGLYMYTTGSISDSNAVEAKNFVAASDLQGAIVAPVMTIGTVTSSSVALSWTPALGGQPSYTYAVQRAPDVSGSPGTFTTLSGASALSTTTYTDSTVSSVTKYWYQIVATDSTSGTALTGTSNNASATTIAGILATQTYLPANHGTGTVTVNIVGAGTTFTSSTAFSATTAVTGWSFASKTFVDATHYTIVLNCPAASASAGATGTVTINDTTDGFSTSAIPINTPTLALSPTTGATGTTPNLTITGTNTLWSSETAAGLFTVTGGTGTSFATPTVGSNTSATDVLTAGSTTATLTIKDTSTGATATFAVAGPSTTISVSDSNWFWSPYNWVSDSTATPGSNNISSTATVAKTCNVGAYFRVGFTNTTTANVLYSCSASPLTKIRYALDGGATTDVQQSGNLTLTLSGASTVKHILEFWVIAEDESIDAWNTPAFVTISGLQIDSGGSSTPISGTVAPPAISRLKNILWLGDSVSEGSRVNAAANNLTSNAEDGTLSWAHVVAAGLGAELGNVSWDGQGVGAGTSASRNIPTCYNSTLSSAGWANYYSGHPRLYLSGSASTSSGAVLVPAPDYIIVCQGTNDGFASISPSTIATEGNALLAQLRSAAPFTKILWLEPPGNYGSVKTAFAGNTGAVGSPIVAADSSEYLYNLGSNFEVGISSGYPGSGSLKSWDNLHLKAWWHAFAANEITQYIQSLTSTSSGTRRRAQ